MILGALSVAMALSTTGVSLAIYHGSGDIYLDRSRPGYLPDKDEIAEDDSGKESEYAFGKNGELTSGELEEYLTNLRKEIDALDVYKNAFSADGLSDAKLGI